MSSSADKYSTVSIVMSVYNGMPDLHLAVESIRQQTITNWELIIINDGSTDGSEKYLDSSAALDKRIKVYHQENRGLALSLHRAVEAANHELIARMDADDISSPNRLKRQIEFMNQHPDHVLMSTWSFNFEPHGLGIVGAWMPNNNSIQLKSQISSGHCVFVHGSIMFRKSAYQKVTGYRIPCNAEDLDLWCQMMCYGEFGVLESFEYMYRLNTKGLSYKNIMLKTSLIELILKLKSEREQYGKEITDYKYVCTKLIAHNEPLPPAKCKQIEQYGIGMIHLSAGYRKKAMKSLFQASGINVIGIKATIRLILALFNNYGSRGIVNVFHAFLCSYDSESQLSWTVPWLKLLKLPTIPYIHDSLFRRRRQSTP